MTLVYLRCSDNNRKTQKLYCDTQQAAVVICATELTRERHEDSFGPVDVKHLVVLEQKIGEVSSEQIVSQVLSKKLTQQQIENLMLSVSIFEPRFAKDIHNKIQNIRDMESELGMSKKACRPWEKRPPLASLTPQHMPH